MLLMSWYRICPKVISDLTLLYTHFIPSRLLIHPGAAMAVEDGAALAEALNHAHSVDDIIPVLNVYQEVRIKRSSQMQQASLVNGVVWHFPDGPEQEARDAAMRAEIEGRTFMESPNQWSDPTTQAWAYGYDAVGAIADAFLAG
jgi:salicylate hydroxylase